MLNNILALYNKAETIRLFKLSLPIIIAQFLQTSMLLIDTIMAGRVSTYDMAAIAVGESIWLPLILFGQGLLYSLPTSISFLNASGKRKEIAHYVRQGFWIALMVSIPIFFIVYHSNHILDLMQMEKKLADITYEYLQYLAFGIVAYLFMINLRCLNEGLAQTKPAMFIAAFAVIIHVPLNYIFIYGKFGIPAFGAVGCGISTCICYWIMFGLLALYCYQARSQRDIQLFKKIVELPSWKTINKLGRLGIPIALTICAEVTLFTMVSLILSPLGANVVASHQIALHTSALIFVIPLSFSMAVTVLIGQSLGEKSHNKTKIISRNAMFVTLLIAIIVATSVATFKTQIASIFVSDKDVIAMASSLLLLAAIFQIPDTLQAVTGGVLRGYKDTKAVFIITIICYWLIGLVCGYTLAMTDLIVPKMAATGFWIGFIMSLTCAAILLVRRLKKLQSIPDEKLFAKLDSIS